MITYKSAYRNLWSSVSKKPAHHTMQEEKTAFFNASIAPTLQSWLNFHPFDNYHLALKSILVMQCWTTWQDLWFSPKPDTINIWKILALASKIFLSFKGAVELKFLFVFFQNYCKRQPCNLIALNFDAKEVYKVNS